MNEFLYRVVSLEDWEEAQGLGRVPRCGSDDRDGFVHLSTEETFIETANLYFEISEAPLALEIDPKLLGDDLKWESVASRGVRSFSSLVFGRHSIVCGACGDFLRPFRHKVDLPVGSSESCCWDAGARRSDYNC